MIKSSQLFNAPKHASQHLAWMDITEAFHRSPIYHSDKIDSTTLTEALHKVMSELVKVKQGVKPDVPLRMESEDGVPAWLMEAWVFDGFRVVEVSKHRQGSQKGDMESRLEFVPINM